MTTAEYGFGAVLPVAAEPYPYMLRPRHTALLVIDMQNDFCSPGGFGERLGNDITPTRTIIPCISALLDSFRARGLLVIHTREGHLPDLSDCPPSKQARMARSGAPIGEEGPMGRLLIRGEHGHDIIDELAPAPGEFIIDKPGKGAFWRTELDALLRSLDIHSLIVTGVTTHVCVHTTIREANDRGYDCLLVRDAAAAYDPIDHEAAVRMTVQQGGIFGFAALTEDILAALSAMDGAIQ